ncbi:hypothetical protein F3Y22_tig00006613pilonHSYRG00070 [Hibiscus syriacus]|uniref:Myb domain protein 4r1 n=1 Tax=Hibiscus syriacus TaxID=106335 RepID=A0A6A3CBN8_HIBSY|nr:hypothetical protein F3Y22_tig00006613pilonHSYRG00070 [Hibiscus syriacus]
MNTISATALFVFFLFSVANAAKEPVLTSGDEIRSDVEYHIVPVLFYPVDTNDSVVYGSTDVNIQFSGLDGLEYVPTESDRPSTSDAAASAASTDTGTDDDIDEFFLRFFYEDAEDDLETFRVIQKRVLAYSTDDAWKNSREDDMEKREPTYMTRKTIEEAISNDIWERFQDHEQSGNISHVSIDNVEMQSVGLVQLDQSDVHELSTYKSSRFPKSAQLLFDAIKKNRSYQKLLQCKLTRIEVKIEENKKLKERVKILRNFQVPSAGEFDMFLPLQDNDREVTADYGPPENSSVASYKMALMEFPLRLHRWLNHEDPLINRNPWAAEEDKNLLFIAQEKEIDNWLDIAVLLGSNRTPFQCLTRYQRSLNVCILKREWTEEEEDQLRIAVEVFGECDWQSVASTLKGRTGTQCSNRWKKSLHPTRQRVGRWTRDEDKRLIVAVMLFGPENWWVNSLDPALNVGIWTEEEEDTRLETAIEEHGYCWRWKTLHPEAVPLLREARKVRKAALISNFVDRESERPALGPNDFNIQLPIITAASEPENTNRPSKRKRKKNDLAVSVPMIAATPEPENMNLPREGKRKRRLSPEKKSHRRCRKGAEAGLVEVLGIIDENEAEAARHTDYSDQVQDDAVRTEKRKQQPESSKCVESVQDNSSSHPLSTLCMTTNHQAESLGSSLTVKRRKNHRGAPKQCSERIVNELHEEQCSICSENSVFSRGDDGAEVVQNSSVELENRGAEDASKKKSFTKPRSKRKTCTTVSNSQCSRIVEAKDSAKKNTKKRRTWQQHSKSRNIDKQSGDEDHQTLACSLRNKSKKRRQGTVENAQLSTLEGTGDRSQVDDVVREPDKLIEEDMTLACWCKQLKKRRVTMAQRGDTSK